MLVEEILVSLYQRRQDTMCLSTFDERQVAFDLVSPFLEFAIEDIV